jgi:hypothetical protein
VQAAGSSHQSIVPKLTVPSYRRAIAGALVSVVVASAATAQGAALAVDPATYAITLYGGVILGGQPSVFSTTPGSFQYVNPTGSSSANIQTSPFTMLTAHATSATFGNCSPCSSAQSTMFYYFRIVGKAGTRVSATFAADLFVSIALPPEDEASNARSQFFLQSIGGNGHFYDLTGAALAIRDEPSKTLTQRGQGTTQFNAPVNFTIDANEQYRVVLNVSAQTEAPNTADAYIDPVITIDPGFQDAYSLLLSPGVSNLGPNAPATVPEPASLALVGAGLLGVAGMVRRRAVGRQ